MGKGQEKQRHDRHDAVAPPFLCNECVLRRLACGGDGIQDPETQLVWTSWCYFMVCYARGRYGGASGRGGAWFVCRQACHGGLSHKWAWAENTLCSSNCAASSPASRASPDRVGSTSLWAANVQVLGSYPADRVVSMEWHC